MSSPPEATGRTVEVAVDERPMHAREYHRDYMHAYNQLPRVKEQKQKYRGRPETKERDRENHRVWGQLPENKERNRLRQRARRLRLEVKEQERAYAQRPEVKERRRVYSQRSEVRERERIRSRSREAKDRRMAYLQRPEVQERLQEHYRLPKVKARNRAYAGAHRIEAASHASGIPKGTIPTIPPVCDLCGKPFGKGKKEGPALDHDHTTNKFRGWTHGKCNLYLIGANTQETALAVYEYLKRREVGRKP